jgi:hypothetical protein
MFRHIGKLALATLSAAILALLGTRGAMASEIALFGVNYYDTTLGDNALRIANPTINNLCADIYVFDANEELQECCGCPMTAFGLRRLSVASDLTTNPYSNGHPYSGVIEIVPSAPGEPSEFTSYLPTCDASYPSYEPQLRSWVQHINAAGPLSQVTSEKSVAAPLWISQYENLAYACKILKTNGSGRGICKCGTGDNFHPIPPVS